MDFLQHHIVFSTPKSDGSMQNTEFKKDDDYFNMLARKANQEQALLARSVVDPNSQFSFESPFLRPTDFYRNSKQQCSADSQNVSEDDSGSGKQTISSIQIKKNSLQFLENEGESSAGTPLEQEKLERKLQKILFDCKKEKYIYDCEKWQQQVNACQLYDTPQFEVEASIKYGIPNQLRPLIWMWLINVKKFECQHAPDIFLKLKELNSMWDWDIQKDITRTYPENEYFKREKSQERLFLILRAYANYDKEIGYTQGMNFIVACLIYHMDPERYEDIEVSFGLKNLTEDEFQQKVFWILVFVCHEKNWREVYIEGTQKILSLNNYLDQQLQFHLPLLYEHIKTHEVDVFSVFSQYIPTLLLYFTHMDFTKRIIDMFLLAGEKILIDILIRGLSLCQDFILSINSFDELFKFLRRHLFDYCYLNCEELLQKDEEGNK